MLKSIATIFFSLYCLCATAQVQINSANDDELAAFRKSTTVFILQDADKDQMNDYNKAIAAVWTVTPFKTILVADADQYLGNEQYSIFGFSAYIVTHNNGSTNTHISYDLSMPHFKKNGKLKGSTMFGRFMVCPDQETLASSMITTNSKKSEAWLMNKFYTSTKFANWGPGFIKGYLKTINDGLLQGKQRGIYGEMTDKDGLHRLGRDTLFVPNYVNKRFSMFVGDRGEDKDMDTEGVRDAYPHRIKFVSDAELNQMLVNRTQPFYYLIFIRSSTDKYVNVFEGATGNMLYACYTPMSYNFKNKDLKKIAKIIEK